MLLFSNLNNLTLIDTNNELVLTIRIYLCVLHIGFEREIFLRKFFFKFLKFQNSLQPLNSKFTAATLTEEYIQAVLFISLADDFLLNGLLQTLKFIIIIFFYRN